MDIQELSEKVRQQSAFCMNLLREVEGTVIGQKALVESILTGILADGHVLLEGLPGLAKTTAVKAFADAVSLDFKRIQFTPDLLPADLLGTTIYNAKEAKFETRKGPLFTNLVLADEINRAPSKVQSALLEAMQERHITIGDETFKLDEPFLVLATQNPIEQEGTYPLPEAQVDRFLLKVKVSYPNKDDEMKILDAVAGAGCHEGRYSGRPPAGEAGVRGRTRARIHCEPGACDSRSGQHQAQRPGGFCGSGRLSACFYRSCPGLEGPRIHPGPCLRDAGRREGRRYGSAPPPHYLELRGRSGRSLRRDRGAEDSG